MRNTATVFASLLSLGAAYFLYAENIGTRRIEAQVQAAERHRERLENDITVLKADRAYLSRPARIEPAARVLGLSAPGPRDYVSFEDVVRARPAEAGRDLLRDLR